MWLPSPGPFFSAKATTHHALSATHSSASCSQVHIKGAPYVLRHAEHNHEKGRSLSPRRVPHVSESPKAQPAISPEMPRFLGGRCCIAQLSSFWLGPSGRSAHSESHRRQWSALLGGNCFLFVSLLSPTKGFFSSSPRETPWHPLLSSREPLSFPTHSQD